MRNADLGGQGAWDLLSVVHGPSFKGMGHEVRGRRSEVREHNTNISFFKSEVRNSKSSACCPLKALSLSKGWILDAGCDY